MLADTRLMELIIQVRSTAARQGMFLTILA
jgi:hypothetical protein